MDLLNTVTNVTKNTNIGVTNKNLLMILELIMHIDKATGVIVMVLERVNNCMH